MNKELISFINKYKTDTIPNNFSVQIYDKKTDNKLDILYIACSLTYMYTVASTSMKTCTYICIYVCNCIYIAPSS